MFSSLELIIVATFIGITISRTTLVERLKMWFKEHKLSLLTEAMDCPLCSSFWTAILLNIVFFSSFHDLVLNVSTSALLGFFIGKEY